MTPPVSSSLSAPPPIGALVRRVAWMSVIGLAIALCAIGTHRWARRVRPPLPTLASVPDFTMRDQRNRPVTERSLRGAVSIVDFFFTSCPISCPKLTARMAQVEQELAARHPNRARFPVRLVSISVDPETDTPAKLAQYARRYDANDDRWWFLTGPGEALDRVVVEGFKMNYRKADPAIGIHEIMHGNWFVLVDATAKIRGYYLSDDAARVQELVEDAEQLTRDPA